MAIVQTPQHFFNPDPIQSSLLGAKAWPDEQRFFFNYLLEAKDAWGAAFCCGTSAVVRVSALEAIGGMATETVTEDMLTTFKLKELRLPHHLPERAAQPRAGPRRLAGIHQAAFALVPRQHSADLYPLVLCRLRAHWSRQPAILPRRCQLLDVHVPVQAHADHRPAGVLVDWHAVVNADAQDIVYWLAPSVAASMTSWRRTGETA